ncbi:MAG: fibronectin type III domain-containing protein [bacterium]
MKKNGYFLFDLIIIIVLILIMGALAFRLVISQQKRKKHNIELFEMQRNIRISMDFIKREFQQIEYEGTKQNFPCNLTHWINIEKMSWKEEPMYLTLNNQLIITFVPDNRPDILTFFKPTDKVFALAPKDGSEYHGAEKNDTRITLRLSPSQLKKNIKVGDIIRIGKKCCFAKVKDIVSQSLTIDTDPTTVGNQSLATYYPPNEEVAKIDIITYALFNEHNDPSFKHHDEGHPRFVRRFNNEKYESIGEDLTDFQIKAINRTHYKIYLTGATKTGEHPQVFSLNSTVELGKQKRIKKAAPVKKSSDTCPLPARCNNFKALSEDMSGIGKIHLSWDPVTTDVDGNMLRDDCRVINNIIYYGSEVGEYDFHHKTGTKTEVICTPKGITSCSVYITVAAQNRGGIGSKASPVMIKANENFVPQPPRGLQGTVGRDGISIDLAWAQSAEKGVRGYNIYRLTSEKKDFKLIGTIEHPYDSDFPPSYHDANFYDLPILCRAYFYKITAVGCPQESDFSEVVSVYLEDKKAPTSPKELVVRTQGMTVKLSWEKSLDDGGGDNDVDGYNIYGYDAAGPHKIGFVAAGYTSYVRDNDFKKYGVCVLDKCGNESKIVTIERIE